jgi:hypothetical protein
MERAGVYQEVAVFVGEMQHNGRFYQGLARDLLVSLRALVDVKNDVCDTRTSKELLEHDLVRNFACSMVHVVEKSNAAAQSFATKHSLPISGEALSITQFRWHAFKQLMIEIVSVLKKPEYDKFVHVFGELMQSGEGIYYRECASSVITRLQEALPSVKFDCNAIRGQLEKMHQLGLKSGQSEGACEHMRLLAIVARDIIVPVADMVFVALPKDEQEKCDIDWQNARAGIVHVLNHVVEADGGGYALDAMLRNVFQDNVH